MLNCRTEQPTAEHNASLQSITANCRAFGLPTELNNPLQGIMLNCKAKQLAAGDYGQPQSTAAK